MLADFTHDPRLAPLQRWMLRDSLADGASGHHVEQVEIAFASGPVRSRVSGSWRATVDHTEALQGHFLTDGLESVGWQPLMPADHLILCDDVPESWEAWRELDRLRQLLTPHDVPWRATYWPKAGRFIWTFHHALLDGRSMTKILSAFFKRLAGDPSEVLPIAHWHAPSQEVIAQAARRFIDEFAELEEIRWAPADVHSPSAAAVRVLGQHLTERLESGAAAMEVNVPTLLIWAWGQALIQSFKVSKVIVEQLRAGAPQAGTAGFTMNTLPVLIHLEKSNGISDQLREFRNELLALRAIEAVSADDFSPNVFPDTGKISTSVIMVERGTLHHLTGISNRTDLVESLVLHEAVGETLMATAYLLPDLKLIVEGPEKHDWLERWVGEIEHLISRIHP